MQKLSVYPCIEKQENDHLMPFDLCYQFRSMNQKILDNIACFYKSCFNEKMKELFYVIKVLLALNLKFLKHADKFITII